jgi:hypothetical protein
MATDTRTDDAMTFDGTELEFWLGNWDARWGEAGQGTNHLTRILNDKVIREDFSGGGPNGHLVGLSLSVFDAQLRVWHQTWVDDSGGYIELVGEQADGWFSFGRDAPEVGPAARQRMVFRDIQPGSFRWTWELSEDGGATWSIRWDIAYTRQGEVVGAA